MKFSNLSSPIKYLAVFSLFLLLIFVVLGKSLHFSLFGDDWFMFYVIDKHYGPGNQFPYLSLKGYFQPWGVMNLSLIIIRHFFGYLSYGYFLVSMVLRVIASFAGFLFLSKFLKSKFIGLIGSLFVLVGYAGIESSNYVLHMNVYLVIIFLFLSLIFLIDSYKSKFWKFILGCFLFALSLAVNPLRSHGLLPFIIIFDVIFGIAISKASFKKLMIRQIFLIITALIIYKLGFFGAVHLNIINITVILQMIRDGNYTFISAFVTNLGKAFLPDLYTINVSSIVSVFGVNWFKWFIATGFLVESLLFFVLASVTYKRIKNYLIVFGILIVNFFLASLILRQFPRDQGLFLILINTFIGIFFISFLFWASYILFVSHKEKKTTGWIGMVVGSVLILTSLVVPLLFNPGAIMGSDSRYFTLSLAGVAITLASLLKITLTLENNKKFAFIILSVLLILLTFNIKNDRKYMTNLYSTRNVEITNLMWNKLFGFLPKNYPDKLLIFYFDDKENPGLANNTILFGFPPRMALEYKIKDSGKIPTFTNIYDEVISTATDGKAFLRLGYPQEKISVNQVFAFKFTKDGDLVDITQKTRKDLVLEISKRKNDN